VRGTVHLLMIWAMTELLLAPRRTAPRITVF
jgi:hypothetical protein